MKKVKLFAVIVFAGAALMFGLFKTSPTASGQTSLATPTGFSATTNRYNNKVGLYWDAIRGATNYRVLRSTTNNSATATDIGTTAANFFFDSTATAGQTFFYWVRAENQSTTSGLTPAAQGVRAIATNQGPVPPLEPPPPGPPANPMTAAKAYLGKALFWDEQLSATRTVSCGSCHRAGTGGSDPRSLVTLFSSKNPGSDSLFNTPDDVVGSPGVPLNNADGTYSWSTNFGFRTQVTGRKANSHINAAYAPVLFWDGRASGTFRDPVTNNIVINNGGALESQAVGPPVSSVEMGHGTSNWTLLAGQISTAKPLVLTTDVPVALETWIGGRTYPELFQEAFGTSDVTPSRIAMAIASYERTLFSDQTPLDLDNAGITPLPPAENRGRGVFGGTQCAVCHAGNLLTNNSFQNIGLRPAGEDTGRFQVTGAQNNIGQFRVPGLRNVALRSSFMHNGKFSTLEEVIEFYNRGGDFRNEPNFAAGLVQPRNLNPGQKADLAAFLRNSLVDARVRNELPPFDAPRPFADTNRVPVIVGTGIAGSNSLVPQAFAIEPPLVGNPSFTVAVSSALGNANVVLVVDETDPGATSTIPATGNFARVALTTQGTGAGNGFASVSLAIPDNAALVGRTFFGRWYVTDPGAAGGVAVSQAFRFTVFGTASRSQGGFVDFDGDGKTDVSIVRPGVAEWWYLRSSDGVNRAFQFGSATDTMAPADFTGDGKTDIAVFRPGTGEWYVMRSEDASFYSFPFGASGDIPAPGDFDADGKADAAVFRPSNATWYVQRSSDNGTTIQQFGANGDVPQVGDYDGDGRADMAIYRPSVGQWWLNRSTAGVIAATFGISSDKPTARDFTGDGKTDLAFWRPSSGEWFVLRSEDSTYYSAPFGISTDIPVAGDYDGDGKADTAVFRPSAATWYVNRSTQGLLIQSFGAATDIPVPSAYTP
ncbi:MAG: VCBS repeat-containing protein [Acidobacteria bacterium]|nr:VCBS repeat-containing protein [Acidobacteriota bacterium]